MALVEACGHHGSMSDGANSSTANPSGRIIEQRVRNRVIEYLELASSFDSQQHYAEKAPIVNVAYEIINQWEDWVHVDPRSDDDQLGVYNDFEIKAMKQFHAAWVEAAVALPDTYPSISDVQKLPAWLRLRDEAQSALGVFMRRGMMPEDREV